MSEFITYREIVDDKLEYFILQKDFPHYVGMIAERPVVNYFQCAPINCYNLFVTFYFTIRGKYIPSYKNTPKEIDEVLQQMAVWFYNNRIMADEKRYKKWKINDTIHTK